MERGRRTARRWMGALTATVMVCAVLAIDLTPTPAGATVTPIQAPAGPIASASFSTASAAAVVDDPANRQVFVADGVNSIRVFDYDAQLIATIANVGAINGMALHRGVVYATNSAASMIERIDATTLTRSSNLVDTIPKPRTPVVLGDRLWVASRGCDGNWGSRITSYDLPGGKATEWVSDQVTPFSGYCPILGGDPAVPDVLLVGESGLSAPDVQKYDLSTGALHYVTDSSMGLSFVGRIAVDPDGQHWYSISGGHGLLRWSLGDMANLGAAFPTDAYASAVTSTGANGGFVAIGANGTTGDDVAVFDSQDILTKRFSWNLGSTDDVVVPNGIAVSADGSRVFAVTKLGLRVFALPGVAGTIADAGGDPQPGVRVEAVATADGSVIDTGTSDEDGWFSIGRAAFSAGQTYQVRYVDPLTGWVTWLGAGGLPVDQSLASTFAFSPDRGQPAGVTMSLAGAAYHAVNPTRVVDTRIGLGAPQAALAPNASLSVPMLGAGGVLPPSGISAVVLNVTAVAPASAGFLTLWPSGTARPPTSNLNYVAGTTVPNLVTVSVGADGAVDLANLFGHTDVIVDVAGWFDSGTHDVGSTGFHPLTPTRVLDTRSGTGGVSQPLGPGASLDLQMKGTGTGVPSGTITAVALNVTVTETSADGYLTVSPSGGSRPTASNLNWRKGVTVPNMVIAKLPADGRLNFFNSSGTTSLVVDVVGWFDDGTTGAGEGGLFHPLAPLRALDTRDGTGAARAKVGSGSAIKVRFGGSGGVPSRGAGAALVNTTVTNTSSWGFLTMWPDGVSRPTASNLNWSAGQTIPNLVLTPLSPAGSAQIYNANGTTDVIGDMAGWFDTP